MAASGFDFNENQLALIKLQGHQVNFRSLKTVVSVQDMKPFGLHKGRRQVLSLLTKVVVFSHVINKAAYPNVGSWWTSVKWIRSDPNRSSRQTISHE